MFVPCTDYRRNVYLDEPEPEPQRQFCELINPLAYVILKTSLGEILLLFTRDKHISTRALSKVHL